MYDSERSFLTTVSDWTAAGSLAWRKRGPWRWSHKDTKIQCPQGFTVRVSLPRKPVSRV